MTFRIEEKFFLNSQNLDNLLSWISSNNGSVLYPERHISSLYFDTDNNRSFLESEEGIVPRKKVRLRSYQEFISFNKEVNLETKITSVEGKFKNSKRLNSEEVSKFILKGLFLKDYGYVYPKIYVSYKRFYFKINDIRLNIDTKIKYNDFKKKKFSIGDSDIVLEFKSPLNNKILKELEIIPFNKRRFSKYARGILYLDGKNVNIVNNY